MRLWHKLTITVVVLGLLGATYWYVSNIKTDNKVKENPADKTISLYNVKSEDVKELHIKNPSAEYTVVKNGDKWGIKEFPNSTFSSSKIENTVFDLISISASRVVEENPSDFAQYGLSSAMAEVTITKHNGEANTFLLGNKIESYYYLKDKASPKVYVVNSNEGEAMLRELKEFRNTEVLEVKPEEVTAFAVAYKDGTLLDISKNDAKGQAATASPFKMNSPYQGSVNNEKFGAILKGFLPINATDFISDNPADVAKFGLDNPDFTVTVKRESEVFKVKLSKQDKVYAMVEGNSEIMEISGAKYDTIKQIDTFNMVDSFLHLVNIKNVNSVVVEGNGNKYTFSITHSIDSNATPDPETKEKPEKEEFSINGKKAEESAAKGAYQSIIGLVATGNANGTPQGDAECTVTFNMKDGSADVYKYVSVDARNYAVISSSGTKYTILKKNVELMLQRIDGFDKDPSKRPE